MAFESLNKEELTKVAEFFAKDVVAADEDDPSKKELIAALESGDPDAETDGDKPVTWDDYKNIYKPAAEANEVKANNDAPELTDVPEPEVVEETEEDDENKVLVKFERKNPRFDIRGYTFTQGHPFHQVDEKTAEYLVRNVDGFRLAMPSEVADFYN